MEVILFRFLLVFGERPDFDSTQCFQPSARHFIKEVWLFGFKRTLLFSIKLAENEGVVSVNLDTSLGNNGAL